MGRSLGCGRQPLAIAIGCLALLVAAVSAQEENSAPINREQIDAALRLTQAAAKEYSIVVDAIPKPLELKPEPALRWSNPAAGEVHGNVFLWTHHGRPFVVGSLFKWFTPHTHMSHEFQSLSEKPLTAKFHGDEVWKTSEPGPRFVPIPKAPPPAPSAAARLLQLKQLARDFQATKKERDGSQGELRLLTQPIHRYEAAAEGIMDGALFVFVQGTDPEVFLLFEARNDESKTGQWHYAATRMNGVELRLHHREQEVWRAEELTWKMIYDHRQTYTNFAFKETPAFLVETLTPTPRK